MKADRLESFVKNNRDEFDHLTPSEDVWNSISSKLDEKAQPVWKNKNWLKVAASIAILVTVSIAVMKSNLIQEVQISQQSELDPEVSELIEAEAFYAQQVSGKLQKIQKCYRIMPDLQSDVEADLNELETMYNALKKDLKENISNKEVIEAMIENNRFRLKLVEDVLEQINC